MGTLFKVIIAVCLVGILAVVLVVALDDSPSSQSATSPSTPTPTQPARPTSTPTPTPTPTTTQPAASGLRAGTHLVGTDMAQGRYRADGGVTYFEILSGLGGELGDIIANEFVTNSKAPVVVDIEASDVAFKFSGSGSWVRIDSSYNPGLKTSFGDGWWVVGADIAPGVYRTQDNVDYWARLSSFRHTLEGIVANEAMMPGGAVVEIKSTDVGFQTSGGATWTKIG